MENEGVRINKYLSEAGVCSRREADRQVEQGNVVIGGKVASMGDKVFPGQQVIFCGKAVQKEEEEILLLVNKPVGIVCTAEKREKNNIIDFLKYPKRIYPVGRLDKDSSGLLLMTNQGDLVNKIMRAGNHHEKEYLVTVNKRITPDFIRGMAGGVPLKELQTMTRECVVEKIGEKSFRIILTQGLNRQIRRMCEYFGYRVVELQRVRIMNLTLGDLKPGAYREITPQELAELKRKIRFSSSETVYPKRDNKLTGTQYQDLPNGMKQKRTKQHSATGLAKTGGQQWKKSRQKKDGKNYESR